MNKKFLLVVFIILILTVVGVYFFRKTTAGRNKINLDDPNQVFNITAPSDFDEYKKQRLEEKITAAKDLYAAKKDDTWTWIVIGNMYEFARDFDRAILAYEKTASLNQSEYISITNLAYIYENEKNDYAKAEEYYKKVVELNGANPIQHINLARLYEFKMNKLDEAEKVYMNGLEMTNNNPDLLVAAIRFYQRADNAEKISEYVGKLLQLYPDNPTYQQDFASLLKKT